LKMDWRVDCRADGPRACVTLQTRASISRTGWEQKRQRALCITRKYFNVTDNIILVHQRLM